MQPTMSPSDFIYRRPLDFIPPVADSRLSPSSDMPLDHGSKTAVQCTAASNHEQHNEHDRIAPGSRATTAVLGMHPDDHLQPRLFGGDSHSPNISPFQMLDMPIRGIAFHRTEFTQHMAPVMSVDNVIGASQPSQQVDTFPEQEAVTRCNEDRRRSTTLSTTDSTISRTVSIYSTTSEHANRLCAAVGATHDICLQATKTYLSSHHANHQARACGAFDQSGHETRLREADVENRHSASADRAPPRAYPSGIPDASDSLLRNISGICNMLWTGSQRDRLLVLGVERIAVDNMARLLAWAETVALGDYDEWTLAEENVLGRVLDAGRNLCAWLGLQESIRDMETLETQLRG